MSTQTEAAGHNVGKEKDWPVIKSRLEAIGFEDVSYINDVTASFTNSDNDVRIWVHEQDLNQRESEIFSRFEVTIGDDGNGEPSFASEDLESLIAFLSPA